jgi:hypothetical protein
MLAAFCNCCNIKNVYILSNNVTTVTSCFRFTNTSSPLSIYAPVNSNTVNSLLRTAKSSSIVYNNISWTTDTVNNRYYNPVYNIYIYPVANVKNAYYENEFTDAVAVTDDSEYTEIRDGVITAIHSYTYAPATINIDSGFAYSITLDAEQLKKVTINEVEVL